LESHLAIPFIQKLKFKVPSGDLHRNTRSLLAISTTWNPIWRFLLFKKRGPIWRPPNSETRDPFWRSPLINLESHLAIPFIQTKYEVPSGDLQIAKYEIPSGDLLQFGIPSGDSFYPT
jgi:hypothetical protein